MANKLYDLFDSTVLKGRDLVASQPRSLSEMMATGSATPDALATKLDLNTRVRTRTDYSDFKNFVHFNSALDYFNVSGERMLNEYPYDGNYNDQLVFTSQSDGYQTYLLEAWPRWSGTAQFIPSASNGGIIYAASPDVGLSGSSITTGLLAMDTGSWTIEFHLDTYARPIGSDRIVLFQRKSSGTGSLAILQGADSYYAVVQDIYGDVAAATATLSGPALGSNYMAWVFTATNTGLAWELYVTDTSNHWVDQAMQRPYVVASGELVIGSLGTAAGKVMVGSGTLPDGQRVVSGNFHMNELRVWNAARTSDQLYANYNTRVYADPNLQLYWRFQDYVSGTAPNSYVIVRDYSGHRLHGSVYNLLPGGAPFYTATLNGMSPQDKGEYRLDIRDLDIQKMVKDTQVTASLYDRNNSNLITNLVPMMYLYLEDEVNTSVLKNLLYLFARQFDELKVYIDNIPNLVTAGYTGFNDAPDALLEEALKFWGWQPKGNFLSKEAFQYFFGFDVIKGAQAEFDNQRLDTQLYEIKNEFWRRTLQNLIYIYKRKGTREAVEALLRVYGMDEKIVKLKEYGTQPFVSIQTRRINSDKSATALQLSGAFTVETDPSNDLFHPDGVWSMNAQVRFPAPNDAVMSPTLTTGSVFHIYHLAGGVGSLASLMAFPLGASGTTQLMVEELRYSRPLTGTTGSLTYVIYDNGTTVSSTFQDVPIFDGGWNSFYIERSGTNVNLRFDRLHETEASGVYSGTTSVPIAIAPGSYNFSLGRHSMVGAEWNSTSGSEYWTRNVSIWELLQTETEIQDHILNPFSHGTDNPDRQLSMSLWWEFDQDKDVSQPSGCFDSGFSFSGRPYEGGNFFLDDTPVATGTYFRDVFEYNFIAPPDYGWNEEKIRTLDAVRVSQEDQWNESNVVALEFNLIDALNEDISYMMSTMDNWNNIIGDPANRHRDVYPALEKLRAQYFRRLTSRINFRAFADFLDFFDRSFVEMVAKLIPARANFKGAEFVVESHMLERPKVQYTYRRQDTILVPEGRIVIYDPAYKKIELNDTAPPPPPIYVPPSWDWIVSMVDQDGNGPESFTQDTLYVDVTVAATGTPEATIPVTQFVLWMPTDPPGTPVILPSDGPPNTVVYITEQLTSYLGGALDVSGSLVHNFRLGVGGTAITNLNISDPMEWWVEEVGGPHGEYYVPLSGTVQFRNLV